MLLSGLFSASPAPRRKAGSILGLAFFLGIIFASLVLLVPHSVYAAEKYSKQISISKAFQLDQNQNIIADIYDTVRTQDGNYATIPNGNYVRVTFEQILDNTNDNTIHARPSSLRVQGEAIPSVEVYPVYTDANGNQTEGPLVATFENIDQENTYKVLLTDLQTPTDVFDLKVIGGDIDFDYIVDPPALVQSVTGGSAGTSVTTCTATLSTVTTGNLIVTAVATDKNAISYTVPSGFTLVQSGFGTGTSGGMAYKISTGGETTITWTQGDSKAISCWAAEYSGMASSGVLDVSVENETEYTDGTAYTSISTGTTDTTTQDSELAVAIMACDSMVNCVDSRAWSNSFSEIAFMYENQGLSVASKTLSSTGTVETTYSTTNVTGDQMYAMVATFKSDVSAAAPADAYWVGGDGDWSDAANHWATSSGGAADAGNLPDSTSNVHFDASSCTGACTTATVTINSASVSVVNLDNSASNITIATSTNGITVTGDSTINKTVSGATAITFSGTGKTITGGSGGAISSPVILGATQTVAVATGTFTMSGIISETGGSFGISKTGANTLTLSGANTFTGGVTIKAGTVTKGSNANCLGANTSIVTIGDTSGSADATLNMVLSSSFANPITIASGSSGNTLKILNAATTTITGAITLNNDLLISNSTSVLTITGGITGAGDLTTQITDHEIIIETGAVDFTGTITNSGTGTATTTISAVIGTSVTGVIQNSVTSQLTLSGVNTFTCGLTIKAGTVNLQTSTSAGGSHTVNGAGKGIITLGDSSANASNVTLMGYGRTFANPIVLADRATATGTLTIKPSFTGCVFSGGVTGTNDLTLNGSSTFTMTFSTGSINNAGTVTHINAGTGATTISAVIGTNVTGVIQNTTTSQLTLSGANTFTGGLTIKVGTVSGKTSSSCFGAGTITLGDTTGTASASLVVTTSNLTIANPLVLATNATVGTLTIGNSGNFADLVTFTGGVTGTNNFTINNNAAAGNASIIFSTGAVDNAGTITNIGSSVDYSTTISAAIGSNVTAIIENGNAPLYVTGTLTVNGSGTTLTNSSGNISGNYINIAGGVTGTGNLVLNNNSTTTNGIVLSTTSVNNTGTITNSGTGTGSTVIYAVISTEVTGITQNSATSALTLSGVNTYTGPITNSAGTLNLTQDGTYSTLTLAGDTTTTFTNGKTFNLTSLVSTATSGHLATINTPSAGNFATLSDTAGINSVSYMSIKDSHATGGADWQSYTTNGNVDATGNTGWVFSSNTAPTGTFNSAVQKTDGTGNVDASITVSDAESNNSKAKVEYTTDATCATGRTKATLLASPVTASVEPEPDVTTANDYQIGTTTPILTTATNTITFEWDSKTDLPAATGGTNYYLCLTANDGTVDQTSIGASSAIAVDNVAPTSVGAPTFGTVTTSSIVVNKPSAVTEAGSGLYQWQARRNSATALGFNTVATTSVTDSPLSANTQYTYDVEFNDVAGNVSSYGTTAQKYTAANTPNAPTISNATSTTLDVNPVTSGAETTMAIYAEQGATCDGAGGLGYVQANGSISASAIWQPDATWSTTTVTGLTAGTQYSFCAKARNGDTDETGFGSAASGTTSSTDATLSNLTISSGTLSPTFASGTTSYTDSVANDVTGVTVTPTKNQANATIKVNNVTVSSGSPSGSINLNVGSNTITTVVTAQDNSTTDTYTITVTRSGSSAKAITAFSFPEGTGTINGTDIAVTVPYGTNVTALVAAFTTTGSSVSVGAITQTSGTTPNNFASPVTYTVTAADSSTQDYTATVTVAPDTTNSDSPAPTESSQTYRGVLNLPTSSFSLDQARPRTANTPHIVNAVANKPLLLSATPPDTDQVKQVWFRSNGKRYLLKPSGQKRFVVTVLFEKPGKYPYALTVDYGSTTRTEYGTVVVAPTSTPTPKSVLKPLIDKYVLASLLPTNNIVSNPIIKSSPTPTPIPVFTPNPTITPAPTPTPATQPKPLSFWQRVLRWFGF